MGKMPCLFSKVAALESCHLLPHLHKGLKVKKKSYLQY